MKIISADEQIGYIILSTMELAAIHYGLGATTMEPQFDAMKAAMVCSYSKERSAVDR